MTKRCRVEACARIEHWLSQHSVEELEELNQIAKQHFLYEGITFTVYGESEGIEPHHSL